MTVTKIKKRKLVYVRVHLNILFFFKKISAARCNVTGFEAFTAVMFQVEVFWVVTPCSVVV